MLAPKRRQNAHLPAPWPEIVTGVSVWAKSVCMRSLGGNAAQERARKSALSMHDDLGGVYASLRPFLYTPSHTLDH
jgi:hypothetical protein